MIDVDSLHKHYGDVYALRGVSFSAERGEILGVLGPNGAGKSSCLRILCGYVEADGGRVRIDDIDVAQDPLAARARIGYLPENNPLYPEMRVEEYLAFRSGLKGARGALRREEARRAMARCGLEGQGRRLVGALSKGYRQRVGLADALLVSPPLIVLDEPTVGLDPNQVIEVRQLVAELREKHTVLLSSHVLPEIEQVCDRVVVFNEGRVVAEENVSALREAQGLRVVIELRESDVEALRPLLDELAPGLRSEALPEGWARLEFETRLDPRERLAHCALERGVALRTLALENRSLEEIFQRLTLGEVSS